MNLVSKITLLNAKKKEVFFALFLVVNLFLCLWWWNYFSLSEDGIPRGDDLNFYFPWVQEFLANPSFETFMKPHGGYAVFLYKLITIFNFQFFKYDLNYYFFLAPIVLVVTSIIFVKSGQFIKSWLGIFLAICLILMIFSPARMGQMSYDMISFQGNVNFLAIFFLMISTEGVVKGKFSRRTLIVFLLAAFLAIFMSVSALTKVFIIPLILALTFEALRLVYLKQGSYTIFIKFILVIIALVVVIILEDLMLMAAGYKSAGSTLNIDLKNIVFAVREGVFHGFIGEIYSKKIGISPLYLNFFKWLVLAFYSVFVIYLSLRAFWNGHIFALALIGAPILFSIVGYNLRGSLNWPRYQGILLTYPISLIYSSMCLIGNSNLAKFKKHPTYSRIFTLVVLCLATGLLIRNAALGSHHLRYAGSVWKYFGVSRTAFFEQDPLSAEVIVNFQCRKEVEVCMLMIEEIRKKRKLEITE